MAYTDFTLETVVSRFNLTLHNRPLLSQVEPIAVPHLLAEQLKQGLELSLATEKARSEFIVAPILVMLRMLADYRVAVYSGLRFDVEPASGLVGECDFIVSASEPVPLIQAPVISIIEAKRGDVELGFGQCVAQMLASQKFNLRKQPSSADVVYGCVTTGQEWRFLRLEASEVTFDSRSLYLSDLGLILARFLAILEEIAPNI